MKKLISIIGLTSSGKSDLAIFLAQKFNGEIVSGDSRQVYRGLDYCSGKVTADEQKLVPHHLIDVASLGEQFTLFDFQKMAYTEIDKIIFKNKIPFLVGGTGLYTRSIVEGYNLKETKPDFKKREELEKFSLDELKTKCEQKGIAVSTEITKRRLVRLLETDGNEEVKNSPRYDVLQIGINFSRKEICERIKIRLERRMPFMLEEIKNLLSSGADKTFLKSLGLEARFVIGYLDGEFSSYDEFFQKLLIAERQFAKRQKTWYNKEKNVIWIDGDENLNSKAEKLVSDFLNNNK